MAYQIPETRERSGSLDGVERQIPVISRKKFIRMFGEEYRPGQHVTIIGPSGRGKSKLGGQMLVVVINHYRGKLKLKVVMLHGKIKGRDDTITELSKAAHMPLVPTYPPPIKTRLRHHNRNGVIVRPLEHAGESVRQENTLLAGEYRKAIHKSYHAPKKRPVILVIDETHQTHVDLKLREDCEGPLMRGRPVCGVWSFVQRGAHISYMVYDQPEWVIIFKDKDEGNLERLAEIGGVDTREMKYLVRRLKTKTVADGSTISQALVFRRSGDQLFIVDT